MSQLAVRIKEERNEDVQDETIKKTKAAIEAVLNLKKKSQITAAPSKANPQFYKYTPNEQAPGHNANCSQRVIRMVEKQTDPLDVPRFRHKRIPRGPSSPPPTIEHSPPKKVTMKDQKEWKIPPCVSNWKNQKGYTIPLDKRIQADGRNLLDTNVNDKFASLSESLYIAERSAREEIKIRNDLIKQKKLKEEHIREQHLRQLAASARKQRNALVGESEIAQNLNIEKQRKKELERDLRLQKSGKRKRDGDRDTSERIALGQAQPVSQESMFDARLFNQTAGMDSGFGTADEKYAAFDKPLFADRSAAGIYRYQKDRLDQNVGDLGSVPAFAGADSSAAPRTAPVEFEKELADPFGLDKLISDTKEKST